MPSIHGTGLLHAGENFFVRGPSAAWWRRRRPVPVIIYAHGATGSTSTVIRSAEAALIRELSRTHLVVVGDLGGDLFGNDTSTSRMDEAVLASHGFNVDPDEPVGLVGLSMGFLTCSVFARTRPAKYLAGIIPAADLNDVVTNNRGGLAASANAAYGGAYSNTTHGPTHSPVQFIDELAADLPVKIWTSSNDTYAVPSTAAALVAARPSIVRVDMGAIGHSDAAATPALTGVVDFCRANT